MKSNRLIIDPTKKGLRKTMKDWQELALRIVWESGEEGTTSVDVCRAVNEIILDSKWSISRASIIFILDDLVELGLLSFETEIGKGGIHRRYRTILNESGYVIYIARSPIDNMIRDFPPETKEILSNYR